MDRRYNRREIKCSSKKRPYPTEEVAVEALIGANTCYEFDSGKGPVGVYLCERCNFFHLTSKGEMNERLREYINSGSLTLQKKGMEWAYKLKVKY